MTNFLSTVKDNKTDATKSITSVIFSAMSMDDRPYADIAARLRWHRAYEGLTQKDYAKRISVLRSSLNNWESGDHRLSLSGAMAIRQKFGVSLDFMYFGNDDMLPVSIRRAWRESPLVRNSQ